jgi:hypothetical protein
MTFSLFLNVLVLHQRPFSPAPRPHHHHSVFGNPTIHLEMVSSSVPISSPSQLWVRGLLGIFNSMGGWIGGYHSQNKHENLLHSYLNRTYAFAEHSSMTLKVLSLFSIRRD